MNAINPPDRGTRNVRRIIKIIDQIELIGKSRPIIVAGLHIGETIIHAMSAFGNRACLSQSSGGIMNTCQEFQRRYPNPGNP